MEKKAPKWIKNKKRNDDATVRRKKKRGHRTKGGQLRAALRYREKLLQGMSRPFFLR